MKNKKKGKWRRITLETAKKMQIGVCAVAIISLLLFCLIEKYIFATITFIFMHLFFIVRFVFWRCPHCGELISHEKGNFCKNCGEKME